MEFDRLRVQAIEQLARALVAADTLLGRQGEEDGEVRLGEVGRPLDVHATPAALVGHRRVVVAIVDDDPTGGQRGLDEGLEQLGTSGHEEVHLGLRRHALRPVQEQLSDAFTQLGSARLPHDQRIAAGQGAGEELDLGGLAGPVGPLESDEEAPHH